MAREHWQQLPVFLGFAADRHFFLIAYMLSFVMDVVVIDTSIFVSAVMKAGTAPRQALRLCLSGEVQPLMGNALFAEYEDVLSRKDLFQRAPLKDAERWQLLDAYLSVCRWVPVYYLWRPNLSDEADNHVIELAVAGNAGWVVTGNKADFKSGELLFPELHIATANEFLKERS